MPLSNMPMGRVESCCALSEGETVMSERGEAPR